MTIKDRLELATKAAESGDYLTALVMAGIAHSQIRARVSDDEVTEACKLCGDIARLEKEVA